jgi:hypothetical protein
MKHISPFLPYVLLVVGLQLAIAVWVPVGLTVDHDYLVVNLVDHIQPRALVGTVSRYVGLDDSQFLLFTQAALFTWLLIVALLIATPREKRVPDRPDWHKCGLVFLFSFSALPFITNAFSGFVDIFAAVTIVLSVWLLHRCDQSSSLALVGVVLLMCVATLIHEKSVFEVLILSMWIAFMRSRRQAASAFAAYALFLAGYAFLASGNKAANGDRTFAEYLGLATQFQSFLEHYSFNVVGVVFGGGLLWVLYATLAVVFVRARRAKDNPFPRLALVFGMLGLCFAPLLFAWDTSRLVAIIWLPTLLLLLEADWQARYERTRINSALLCAACLLQALIPPVLIYRHGAVALNCYASFVVQHFERMQEADSWPLDREFEPVTLHLQHDHWPSDVSAVYACLSIHLVRP